MEISAKAARKILVKLTKGHSNIQVTSQHKEEKVEKDEEGGEEEEEIESASLFFVCFYSSF